MGHNDHEEQEYIQFLKKIVEGPHLDQPALGITKQVISKGEESLSIKQRRVFEQEVKKKFVIKCVKCGEEIPWSEMYDAVADHGMCNYCWHKTEKSEM